MNHNFSRHSLVSLVSLVGLAAASTALAKSPAPAVDAAPPVLQTTPSPLPPKTVPPPSVGQTMQGDPGNLLNREFAVPVPPTVPPGQVAGIRYWSYVYNEVPKRYCVEPKLFTCGPSSAPVSWSPPPVLELLDAADATLYAISAFAVNRIMAVVEKKLRIPGMVVAGATGGGK